MAQHRVVVDISPDDAIEMCLVAHQRVTATANHIDDDAMHRPSRLPGWSVAHVLTHLARNADGHSLRLEAALRGEEVPRYPGGDAQRDGDIEAGAKRAAGDIAADLTRANALLEDVWRRSRAAGWPNAALLAGDTFRTHESPLRRLREVEVHHTDLGLGYEPEQWPDAYVTWELRATGNRLPELVSSPQDGKRLLAWLSGRGPLPADLQLEPWA